MRRHGTRSAYCAGCRCGACTDANTAYHRQRRGTVEPFSLVPIWRRLVANELSNRPGGRTVTLEQYLRDEARAAC